MSALPLDGLKVLDLEHVGTEIGQQQRTEPAGQKPAQVENLEALERKGHGATGSASPSS